MRRRKPEAAAGFPPQLAEFDVDDWWVVDPEDPVQVGYARIIWQATRNEYLAGGDWRSHLGPPVWWSQDRPDP
ncbi:hypothetical protein ACWDFH_31250 [Streptomyces kronopolitis]